MTKTKLQEFEKTMASVQKSIIEIEQLIECSEYEHEICRSLYVISDTLYRYGLTLIGSEK